MSSRPRPLYPRGGLTLSPTNDLKLTPHAGPAVTPTSVWVDSATGLLMLGNTPLDNYDQKTFWLSENGNAVATGTIADPYDEPANAVAAMLPLGTPWSLLVEGSYSGLPFTMPPNVSAMGNAGASVRGLVAAVTIGGAGWATPGGVATLSHLQLAGLVDFQNLTAPVSVLNIHDCILAAGIQTNGPANCASFMLMHDTAIISDIAIINTATEIKSCNIGAVGINPNITLTHSSAATANMSVYIGANQSLAGGSISIVADSPADVMIVKLIGLTLASVTVTAVAAVGGLELWIDDSTNLNFAAGTLAKTTLIWAKQAVQTGYTPTTPGDWSVVPTEVGGALDTLAGAVGGAGDVVGPASATDNALCRFDLATGKLIQNSALVVDDSGNMTYGGQAWLTLPAASSFTAGYGAGKLVTGIANTCVGHLAADALTSGANNCVVGSNAGRSMVTTSNNTVLGISAGLNDAGVGNNILIGNAAGILLSSATGCIHIGSSGSNVSSTIYIGTSQTACYLRGPFQQASASTDSMVTVNSLGLLASSPQKYYVAKTTATASHMNTAASFWYSPSGNDGTGQANALLTTEYLPRAANLAAVTFWVNTGGAWSASGIGCRVQVMKNGGALYTTGYLTPTAINSYYTTGRVAASGSMAIGDKLSLIFNQTVTTMGLVCWGALLEWDLQ